MKHTLIAFLLLLSSNIVSGQIIVGKNVKGTRLPDSDVKQLEGTTTIFVLQDRDMQNKEAWAQAIYAAWKITPFKIISDNEMQDYLDKPGYSFFSFGAELIEHRNSKEMTTYTTVHLYYDLFMADFDKNGKVKATKKGLLKDKDYFSRIYLYPSRDALMYLDNNIGNGRESSERVSKYLYSEAWIYNWTPGMMKGYFAMISNNLKARNPMGAYEEFANETALKKLKRDTLYIPDYTNIKFNPYTGKEKDDDKDDDESIKKAYKYPVKVVSMEELDRLLMDETKEVSYISYVKNSAQKMVNVFNSKTGKMDYSNCTPMSYNFKNKDLSKLAKCIK